MSRIGKQPIEIPAGVTVTNSNNVVTVKGPMGQLSQEITGKIGIEIDGNVLKVVRADETKESRAKHGLYRALISNMVTGVTKGYEKALTIAGVGYKVVLEGEKLVLNVGFSHTVNFDIPKGVTIECPTQTEVIVKGIDKTLVGQIAANIRAIKKPEPYHLYGIRYKNEIIQKKEGKTAGK